MNPLHHAPDSVPGSPATPAGQDGPPTVDALLAAADRLAAQLAETSAGRDANRELPVAVFAQIRRLRLGALRVPVAYGGAGGTWHDVARLFLRLAAGDANIAQAFLSHFVAVERIRLMGSEAQRQAYLPQAAAGLLFGAATAERGGQYRGELATRLTRHGEQYRLNGTKQYCTGAWYADLLKIRCIDGDGAMISALVPADRPGIVRLDDWDGMGQRCTASGTTELRDVAVFAGEILPMEAWKTQRHHGGASAQIIHCAIDAGIALAALDDAVAWARRGVRPVKESGVQQAADDPYILHALGRMSARARAAEAIVLSAADLLETAAALRFGAAGESSLAACEAAAGHASLAVAEAKIWSTTVSLEVAQMLFDIGGASTTLRTHNFDRHWRNARTHTTHDPIAYKYRALGDFYVNGTLPPLTFSY
ncbi:acyl-CoA dehydrogenase family protein [Sodalis sp. RH24]|uniref:acyl-CoA dehydrogenase family protein n=1 Tax=unclassified Sodalis (in: enterobacteria) TaxID=2636512 RepID=UPI0039B533FB